MLFKKELLLCPSTSASFLMLFSGRTFDILAPTVRSVSPEERATEGYDFRSSSKCL